VAAWSPESAFGVGVTSSVPGGGFAAMSGTSMASPFVAGAVARLRAVRPDLDAAAAVGHLEATSRDLGDPGRDDVFGWGALDADRAVAESGSVSTPPTVASAGPLSLTAVPRRGAIVLRSGSPVASLKVYAHGVLLFEGDGSQSRWVVPAIEPTELTVVARDPQGRPYETLWLEAAPRPIADPKVVVTRSAGSLLVKVTLPPVPGRVRLLALSADDDYLDVWVPRQGKAVSVTYRIVSPRRLAWDVTACLEVGEAGQVCGSAVADG